MEVVWVVKPNTPTDALPRKMVTNLIEGIIRDATITLTIGTIWRTGKKKETLFPIWAIF